MTPDRIGLYCLIYSIIIGIITMEILELKYNSDIHEIEVIIHGNNKRA